VRAIVTGGAGFIGSGLVDALIERGDEVVVIDDLTSGERRFVNSGARLEIRDIRSPEAASLIREVRPDVLFHLAAQMSVSYSVRMPLVDAGINIIGSVNLLEAAAEVGSRIVFSSSGGTVYGEPVQIPTPETAPRWPVSPYGVSKLSFEHYLAAFRAHRGIDFVSLRYANVYGPRQSPHGEAGVVAIFCEGLLGRRTFKIHGPGTDTRDYVYVDDVVRANLVAVDRGTGGFYNVGTGRETDVNTIYRLVAERFGTDEEAEHGPARPGDIHRSVLDVSLAERDLGWRPEVDLATGIGRTVDWFRSQSLKPSGQPPAR
jgi:UDP-glucose 4-epimerase